MILFSSQIDWRIQSLKVITFLKQQLTNNKNKILAKINLLEEHNQKFSQIKNSSVDVISNLPSKNIAKIRNKEGFKIRDTINAFYFD